MKGRIVSRPLPVELHSCPTPTFISRWLRRMREGTVWKCDDCRSQFVLARLHSGNLVWDKLSITAQATLARRRLDYTVFRDLLPPVLDPGSIRTSKRRTP